MQPEDTFHKTLGITVGIIVVFVVGSVTLFEEISNSAAPSPVADSIATPSPSVEPVTPTPSPLISTNKPVSVPAVTQIPPVDVPKQTAYVYKNGTYSATGSYMSPGGEDQVAVTLTLTNDMITAVSVTPTAQDGTSRRYESRFVSGYKQYVLGKNIADVNLTNVSGSSLTPIGFNDALAQIKAKAKS